MKSNFLNLNWSDFGKGLLVAVITAVLTYAYGVTQTGDWSAIELKTVASTAVLATISYLFKNLVTNSEGEVLKTEESVK